ncbi:MAG: glycosyltransferase [Actinobacteria bacterium]|nr:MAG: glycosyltransferase [Actinomycetota bacterium]
MIDQKKLISIVIPAYNEADGIYELAKRLQEVFEENSSYDFEAIVVENGSEDGTYQKLQAINNKDPRFKILQLARNFRMDGGITAGLYYATGDAAVVMTADLQDPPELITSFIKKWEEGFDNVYGVVTKRQGTNIIRKMNSQIFYWLINKMTAGSFPKNVSDFRLVDKKVYQTINAMKERNRFLRGMFYWVGFKSAGVEFERTPRFAGESKAHTLKVLELAIKGMLAYSLLPLRLITFFGISLSILAFIVLIFIVIQFILYGVPFPGYGTLMTIVLLLFGFLFVMLGIVSEYIGLIYEEVKQRPNYIVKKTVGL